jgi:hypothetical protein
MPQQMPKRQRHQQNRRFLQHLHQGFDKRTLSCANPRQFLHRHHLLRLKQLRPNLWHIKPFSSVRPLHLLRLQVSQLPPLQQLR